MNSVLQVTDAQIISLSVCAATIINNLNSGRLCLGHPWWTQLYTTMTCPVLDHTSCCSDSAVIPTMENSCISSSSLAFPPGDRRERWHNHTDAGRFSTEWVILMKYSHFKSATFYWTYCPDLALQITKYIFKSVIQGCIALNRGMLQSVGFRLFTSFEDVSRSLDGPDLVWSRF